MVAIAYYQPSRTATSALPCQPLRGPFHSCSRGPGPGPGPARKLYRSVFVGDSWKLALN